MAKCKVRYCLLLQFFSAAFVDQFPPADVGTNIAWVFFYYFLAFCRHPDKWIVSRRRCSLKSLLKSHCVFVAAIFQGLLSRRDIFFMRRNIAKKHKSLHVLMGFKIRLTPMTFVRLEKCFKFVTGNTGRDQIQLFLTVYLQMYSDRTLWIRWQMPRVSIHFC